MGAVEQFEELLRAEREAAIAADLDALERIQEQKLAALEPLGRELVLDERARSRVVREAQANTRLLRQLSELHRALVESAPDRTYGARGAVRASAGPGRVRGTL